MPTITLGIRKTLPNSDGTFGIKIVINAKGRTTYISTRFKIDSLKQWKDGKIVRHPDADIYNRKLRALLFEYENIFDAMPNLDYASAGEIKEYVEERVNRTNLLKDFGERYIKRLKSEKRESYAQNMGYTLKYLLDCFSDSMTLEQFSLPLLKRFEKYLRDNGSSNTTINIRMSHVKALLNAAVAEGYVEFKVFPFRNYKVPPKNIRDICISRAEFHQLRDMDFTGYPYERKFNVSRDLFMLSFYCAGINLTDLIDAKLDGDTITFIRKKTAAKKQGEKEVSLSIQPEARAIINKYITPSGTLDFGYGFKDYGQFRSFITKGLNRIGEILGFEKKLMFYSARKTFCQYGMESGIPLYVLEYAIGQTIKDANSRPIYNYIKIMRKQADEAIRTIIDFSNKDDESED